MTDTDVIGSALSADALHRAAKEGERAAQTLLVMMKDGGIDLIDFAKGIKGPPFRTQARAREMTAFFLCQAAVRSAPSKKIRKTARRYLDESDHGVKSALEVMLPPFDEMRRAAEDQAAAGDRERLDGLNALARGSCVLCGEPFAGREPAQAAICRPPGAQKVIVNAICAVCAALPKQDKVHRLQEKLEKEALPHLDPRLYVENAVLMPLDGDLIRTAEQLARNRLIGVPNATLPPLWLLQKNGEPSLAVIETPWSGDEEKADVLAFLRGFMRANSVDAYANLSEVWMAPEESPVRPRDSDAREEGVLIVVANQGGVTAKTFTIARNADGVCSALEEIDIGGTVSGPLCELLKLKP
jgi:hypothetical protein